MAAPVYKITTSTGTVLVNNLPYSAAWAILQFLQYELNLQGLVFSVGP
ncbi:hypothetical protein PP715_22450 [Ralstonia solanacearum]|uniref:Uncharacterized protein n=1 Tax=Ralstonia solanacearum (strain Po82) TaxID=1031711 RepID=F6G004_RALS8|nr:hypothetical protein [Ralstonia solanacearum]AEG68587.1 conserved hypothetical protein [Ralstonia solanacearum Po82]MBB6587037.1 hypothetical protein [Ralstonia solanacearum]MCG3577596.1 hypothetical protein [Ralstonia solanacearum]MCL9840344.1 hypothetical protein [Ralstonia solanacearum]MDB0533034.1 hypothetical protein [Ralstonia solanacearum]